MRNNPKDLQGRSGSRETDPSPVMRAGQERLAANVLNKLAILCSVMLVLGGLSGCTHWGITRSTYQWGADLHSMTQRDNKASVESYDRADYFHVYQYGGDFYVRCNHEYLVEDNIGNLVVDRAKTSSASFLRAKAQSFDQILGSVNIFRHHRWFDSTVKRNPEAIVWDVYDTKPDEARLIEGSGGIVFWKLHRYAKEGSGYSARAAYQHFEANERLNSSPMSEFKSSVHPNITFMLFSNVSERWRTQSSALVVIKSPLFLLTVPLDIITGPLQTAWDDFRIGP